MRAKREYGDYQTPEFFSKAVCTYLKETRKLTPTLIIEPTCGKGSFLKSSLIFNAQKIIGIEVNPKYCALCAQEINSPRVKIINANFFEVNLDKVIEDDEEILIVGNPPWVNNSTLAALESQNLPLKENFKGLKGIEALTGASNFDICESIILKLIALVSNKKATVAMLCKTSVARNVFAELRRTNISFKSCEIIKFNAQQVFEICVSACLLVIKFEGQSKASQVCKIYDFDKPCKLKNTLLYKAGQVFSQNALNTEDFLGICCFKWRQGIKHDCAKVMELTQNGESFINGLKETVSLESTYLYPLVKSSMFKVPILNDFSKFVIVTQKKIRDDTAHLEFDAPKTWEYLKAHQEYFLKRKSSIYKNAPPFSMFGVGDYAFAKYKVGLSGFYKKPLFSLLVAKDHQAVMVDDTCYFIGFDEFSDAYTAMLILNSQKVQDFLISMAFLDAKRPYTIKVLERIDFNKIVKALTLTELKDTEEKLGLKPYITETMLENFAKLVEFKA